MKITKDEVIHVANLARLDLDENFRDQLAGQIGKILEYVDTEGVPSTSCAIFLNNALREDSVKESLDRDKALANAPEKEDGNFIVPKVINS